MLSDLNCSNTEALPLQETTKRSENFGLRNDRSRIVRRFLDCEQKSLVVKLEKQNGIRDVELLAMDG